MQRFKSWRQAMAAGANSESARRKEAENLDTTIQKFIQVRELSLFPGVAWWDVGDGTGGKRGVYYTSISFDRNRVAVYLGHRNRFVSIPRLPPIGHSFFCLVSRPFGAAPGRRVQCGRVQPSSRHPEGNGGGAAVGPQRRRRPSPVLGSSRHVPEVRVFMFVREGAQGGVGLLLVRDEAWLGRCFSRLASVFYCGAITPHPALPSRPCTAGW